MLHLSETDHHTLDRYLNAVLDAYRDGKWDQLTARSDLAHVIAAAAKDNGNEVVPYAKLRLSELTAEQ
ncbi:MAG: hypothetical protein OXQ84_20485 [bacterium]|nr:hypothetical protein [bacterium]